MKRAALLFPLMLTLADAWGGLGQDLIFTDSFEVGSDPVPTLVAPPLEVGVPYDIGGATRFLYTGPDAVQQGMDPATIDDRRVAVLRGRVLDDTGAPLPEVRVEVLNHPEFGFTFTRADGWFDMAVNGGGILTLDYTRDDRLPAQRSLDVPWRDFVIAPDIVLMELSARVDTVALTPGAPIQMARGEVVSDADGQRQATLMFQEGTQAEMVMPDGSTAPLATLNVRATEYTVGEMGPMAMPAELPAFTEYTYAVELSVDEAQAAGATEVRFSQPVSFYVDNYLGFPVGVLVPSGFYNRQSAQWVPSDNGLVIKVVGRSGDRAVVDLDGDDVAESEADLLQFGFTVPELQQLAANYADGETLWRVPISHFTPYDFNYPEPPPEDNPAPERIIESEAGDEEDAGSRDVDERSDCEGESSSTILCQLQAMAERIPVVGTSYSLNYRSDRVFGDLEDRSLTVRLLGRIPQSRILKSVEVIIDVAGQRVIEQFEQPAVDQTLEFTWDGLDAYGRPVLGATPVSVTVVYFLEQVYCLRAIPSLAGARVERVFDQLCESNGAVYQERVSVRSLLGRQENSTLVGRGLAALGGWTINAQHFYDRSENALYLGDGTRVTAPNVSQTIDTIAGGGQSTEDGVSAVDAKLGGDFDGGATGVASAPDGSIYVAVAAEHRIRRIDTEGVISTVAGQIGSAGFAGDGGEASAALLDTPLGLAVGPDGAVYFLDSGNRRVRRIGADGIIDTVAGGGNETENFTGRLATDIDLELSGLPGLAVGRDGTLFIATTDDRDRLLLKVGPGGLVEALPPRGLRNFSIPRVALRPSGYPIVALGGELLSIEASDLVDVYRPAIAAKGMRHFLDRTLSKEGPLIAPAPFVLADGSLLLAGAGCLLKLQPPETTGGPPTNTQVLDGVTYRVRPLSDPAERLVGDCLSVGAGPSLGDGGPALAGRLGRPFQIAVTPDDDILIAEEDGDGIGRIRRIQAPSPELANGELLVPDPDEAVAYVFSINGRHLRTVNVLTGAVLLEFEYDDAGRLVAIRDAFGNETTIERDSAGAATAIVAPFGQRTALAINAQGLLDSIANPAGETYAFDYDEGGLITGITDPAGNTSSYSYSSSGALLSATAGDGYQQSLNRSKVEGGYEIARRTGLGLTSIYRVSFDDEGGVEYVNVDETGAETIIVQARDNTRTVLRPTGTVEVSSILPDDRFGVQKAGGEVFRQETPGGSSLEVITQQSIVQTDPDDPFSIESVTQLRTVGDRTATSTYDAASRTITTTSPTGRVQTATLDEFGRPVESQLAPGFATLTQDYDARGRLVRKAQGGEFVEYEYDDLGRVTVSRNTAGDELRLTYDVANRPLSLTTPGNRTYQYAYDPLGRPTSITLPTGAVHSLSYTLDGKLASYSAPGADPLVQQFDADRRRTGVVLPDGRTRTIEFDASHRLNAITYPEASVALDYLGESRLIGTMTWTPVAGGAAHSIVSTFDGDVVTSMAMGSDVFSYRSDEDLRLAGIQLNTEPEWTFVHDDDDFVTGYGPFTITRDGPGGTPGAYSDGVLEISYSFDELGRLSRRAYRVNGTLVYAFDLAFETGSGWIAQRTESVGGASKVLGYIYSPDGELTTVTEGAAAVESFAYDVNGNRTSANGTAFTYDAQDRMLTAGATSYVFDASGMLAARGADVFTYSARGELLSAAVDGGETVTYGYDALGRRASRTDSSGTTTYLFGDPNDPMLLLASRAPDGTLTRYFYDEAGALIGFERGGSRFYLAVDQVGSPRLILDDSGSVLRQIDYDSFGVIVADTNPGFDLVIGYAGGLADPETGLVRFGFRDYEPGTGRWTSRDPILFEGGQFNLYAYADSNPVSLRDPIGLFCVGYHYYTGYGGGGKLCFNLDGTVQLCAEVGIAAGGGVSIDINGSAKAGYTDYVKAEAALGCGPAEVGANVTLDDCGDIKVCGAAAAKISAPATFQEANDLGFKAGGQLCYSALDAIAGDNPWTATGPMSASVNEKQGSNLIRESSGPQRKVNFGGKIKCKASAGLKGGACYGLKF